MLKNKKIDLKTVVFAVLISLGSALRVLFLDQNDLWYDEGYLLITTGYFRVPELNSIIINPPLYYELIKFWTKLFGVSELSLRLPSAIFSSAALLVLFILAKKMFNRNTALSALLLMALNLLVGEVVARTTGEFQLVGLARKYLGKWGGYFMTVLNYLMAFGILVVGD